jgi:hypothetical protein
VEVNHEHAAHPHPTGHRWLDISLAASAMCISVVSLVVAILHGRTMERMAEANARLVAANSWPFLEYGTDNTGPNGERTIQLRVMNDGVGPAKVESFEIWWGERPVANPEELLKACCSAGDASATMTGVNEGLISPRILRAGQSESFLTMELRPENTVRWQRLNSERMNLKLRICYCSVFDECWTSGLKTTRAERVAECPKPAVPYSLSARWGDGEATAGAHAH